MFNFGSISHRSKEAFNQQVLNDLITLATCIHLLASSIDLYNRASNSAEFRKIKGKLKQGQGVVDKAAKDFESIIQTGGITTCSSLRDSVTSVYVNTEVFLENLIFKNIRLDFADLPPGEDHRLMDGKEYSEAWEIASYEIWPHDLCG
jgi:hypothetical protein